nr:APC family permease [Sporolactobacillus pectinivorans]
MGFGGALFQSISHISPGVGLVFGLAPAMGVAGAAAPLSTLLGLIATLFVAYSLGQLSRAVPSAGYYMTWLSRAFSPRFGFLAAWITLFSEGTGPAALFLVMSWLMQGSLPALLGWNPPWIVWDVLLAVILFLIACIGVKVSAGVGMVLGFIELAVFTVLAAWLIIRAGAQNSFTLFTPQAPGVQGGWSGIFRGMIFVSAAFSGFETAAPLAEETRNAKRNIPAAIVGATLVVGLFFIFAIYAGVLSWGPDRIGQYLQAANPWESMARNVWGIAGIWIVFLALLNSTIAVGNASITAGSRLVFAMGRAGIFSQRFARVSPVHRSPVAAITLITGVNLIISIGVALIFHGPVGGFSFLETMGGVLGMILYVSSCIAVPVLYLHSYRQDFSWIRHFLIPTIGVICFIFPLVSSIYPLPKSPMNWATYMDIAWLVAGILWLIILNRRDPQAVQNAAFVISNSPKGQNPKGKKETP